MRFMSTLATISDLLDAPGELDAEAGDLALAHASVGVRAAHFAPMGIALMVTLARPSARHSLPSCRRRGTRPTTISRRG